MTEKAMSILHNKIFAYSKYYLKTRLYPSSGAKSSCRTGDTQLFQLIGLPRSGTTILASLLDNHHKVLCLIEPFYSFSSSGFIKYSIEGKNRFFIFATKHLFRLLKKKYPMRVIGFKETYRSDNSLSIHENFTDGVKTFAIIRDPRAIWYSICTRFQDSKIDAPTESFTQEWKTFYDWVNVNNILVIKYEELIMNPEDNLRRIFESLGLSFHDAVLNIKPKEGGGDHKAQNSMGIDATPIHKFKSMPALYQDFIEDKCKEGMIKLGYIKDANGTTS